MIEHACTFLQGAIDSKWDEIKHDIKKAITENKKELDLGFSPILESKFFLTQLLEAGYDVKLLKYEGGPSDGRTVINQISWINAEPERKGEVKYKHMEFISGTQYKYKEES